MCFLCSQEKRGGFENTAVGTWSKGISLIFCSSIFLLQLIDNEDQLKIWNKLYNEDYRMVFFLTLTNIIGGCTLLLFSLLGHFLYKQFLRPIYLTSFVVSLSLFSSAVFTSTIGKNISLKTYGIMDALKFHPEYRLVNAVIVQRKKPDILPLASTSTRFKTTSLSDLQDRKLNKTGLRILTVGDGEVIQKTPQEALLDTVNIDSMIDQLKNLTNEDAQKQKKVIENILLDVYEKINLNKISIDASEKFSQIVQNNEYLQKLSENLKGVSQPFKKYILAFKESLFNSSNYELIKHEGEVHKIYTDSLDKIKEMRLKNETVRLSEYITDDMKKRDTFVLSSVLLYMAFIYIHKGATLKTTSSMSISLLYIPCISYLMALACIFVCTGTMFYSTMGMLLYLLGFTLIILLIFSQCFCERTFKFFMGWIYLLLLLISGGIEYFLIKDFNRGTRLYKEYRKSNYNDFYWLLLDKSDYNVFKNYIVFSNGAVFLISIAIGVIIILYSLYSAFYSFRSICSARRKSVSFA